jgi:hypothetical protein
VSGGYIQKGDTITVVMGDTSGGSLGMRAQSFCEREHEIRGYLNPFGTNRYEEMPMRLKLKIVPSWHHELQAVVPGTVEVGKPFAVRLRALDEFGNPTGRYSGTVKLRITGRRGTVAEQVRFPEGTNGVCTVEGCVLDEPGFWALCVEDEAHHYRTCSNPSRAVEPGEKHLYWGDMHGQTRKPSAQGAWTITIPLPATRASSTLPAGRATISR